MNLITREQWGARPPRRVTRIGQTDGLALHHFAIDRPGKSGARWCQTLHMEDRDMWDVAYSMMADHEAVYEGRGPFVEGGHTSGWNSRLHAVAAMVDGSRPVADDLLDRLAEAAVHLWEQGAVTRPAYTGGHRDYSPSSCPGDELYLRIPEINRRAAVLARPNEVPVDAVLLVHPTTGTPDTLAALNAIFDRPDQKLGLVCNADAAKAALKEGKRVWAIGGPACDLVAGDRDLKGANRLDTSTKVLDQARKGF